MLKSQVEIGKVYVAKISGSLTKVRLDRKSEYGGWYATNLATRREVRIRSAAKLRREYIPKIVDSSTPADSQAGTQEKGGPDRKAEA